MKHPTPVYAIEPGFDDRAFAFGYAECKCLCISILGKSLCPKKDKDFYENHCWSSNYISRHDTHYSRALAKLFQDKTDISFADK